MYKNQLQELAQRSCFNLPSYTSIREGPDHAPRFKATVNFNGETFESTGFFTTLRQAEHSAAEVALAALSTRGPSHSLTARILDETGVYKNLLQEVAQRVGAPLPSYSTTRSCLGHPPVFTGTVEIAGIVFTGEPAKNKKQAEKNSAMAAWSSLKQLAQQEASSSSGSENNDEQEQVTLARALLTYRLKEKMAAAADDPDTATSFPKLFPFKPPDKRPLLSRLAAPSGSKILPFLQQRTRAPPSSTPASGPSDGAAGGIQQLKFSAAGAAPYVPIRHCRPFLGGMVPPVTIRTAVPVFSAPPHPMAPSSTTGGYHSPQQQHQHQPQKQQPWGSQTIPVKCASRPMAPPPAVCLRQSTPGPNPFVPIQVKAVAPSIVPVAPAQMDIQQSLRHTASRTGLATPLQASNSLAQFQVKPVLPTAVASPPNQAEIQLLPNQVSPMVGAVAQAPVIPLENQTTVLLQSSIQKLGEQDGQLGNETEVDQTEEVEATAVAAAVVAESLRQLEL